MKLRPTIITSIIAIITLTTILFTSPLMEKAWPYIVVILVVVFIVSRKKTREGFHGAHETLIGNNGWSK